MNQAQVEHIHSDLEKKFSDVIEFEKLKNKKIFLTGSSGFIGQWLLLTFAYLNNKHNFNITVIASDRNLKESLIIDNINTNGKFSFEEFDVRFPFDIDLDTDFIIHLAGTPDRREHSSLPLDIIRTNVDGVENCLRSAIRLTNLKKALIFTSGLVHGKQNYFSAEPHHSPFDNLSFFASYSESKRLAETISHIYASQYQMPIGIVRPYSFIGPLQNLKRPWAINNFINGARLNKSIKIIGNPDTKKSFLYPTDMVYLILNYLISDKTEEPLELGSNEIVSLQEVAESIARNTQTNVSIKYSDKERKTTLHNFYPLKEEISSNMSFEYCLSRSLIWFKISNEQ